MTPIAEALSALAGVLRALGLRWYVFGAQAAIAYGAARATKDVDVTVELGPVTTEAFLAAIAAAGFASRARDLAELAAIARVLPVVHAATAVPFDLVLAGPGLEESFLDHARERRIAGVSVPVARAEDVVVMKLLAGRPHDQEDVLAILRARGESFDEARARDALAALDEALEQGDLVPAFEAALKRAGSR